jgi:hypothetical protein
MPQRGDAVEEKNLQLLAEWTTMANGNNKQRNQDNSNTMNSQPPPATAHHSNNNDTTYQHPHHRTSLEDNNPDMMQADDTQLTCDVLCSLSHSVPQESCSSSVASGGRGTSQQQCKQSHKSNHHTSSALSSCKQHQLPMFLSVRYRTTRDEICYRL